MAEPRKKGLISHGIAAQNRKARYDYKIGETIEAGLALIGPEVKSLRAGRATLSEAWAGERDGEIGGQRGLAHSALARRNNDFSHIPIIKNRRRKRMSVSADFGFSLSKKF